MMSNLVGEGGDLALGTSSWNFDDWRGVFYPEKMARGDYLAFYVQQMNSVEVNSSFYALPAAKIIVSWVETAPAGFSLALKCPRVITHDRLLTNVEGEMLTYLDVLRSLGDAAAPGLIQLPPKLSRRAYGRALADFVEWLAQQRGDLRLAVEVRARDLMSESFIDFLAGKGLAFVLVDREGTPDLFDAWWARVEQGNAPDFAYIRWIGDDRHKPPDNRELRTPRDGRLDEWARRIASLMQNGIDVFGYMHNPYEGHSPASVQRLRERVDRHVALPAWKPVAPEPFEEEDGEGGEGQLSLFT